MTNGPAAGFRRGAALVLSLVLLNASLTFENVWPTPAVQWGSTLSIEAAALVLCLALAGGRARWAVRGLLPLVWILLVFGRYIDVTAPGLYGRELNLYWDSQHLGNVAAMLSRAAPAWTIVAVAAALVLVLAAAYALARAAFGCVARATEHRPTRLGLGAAAGVLITVFAAQHALAGVLPAVAFARPVTPAYVRQARFVAGMVAPGVVAPALPPSPALDAGLEQIEGADVLLVFVESYGAITFEVPEVASGLMAGRSALASAVGDTARRVVSAYVDSPTFGGSSWLAHLSLISGVEVRDQYAYTSLMASRRDTIVTTFARRGYRTVALMPGMRQAWPEGAFYRFDAIYGRDLLEYEGPQFGWWSIPDQYALARLDAVERDRPSRAPLFAVFPTSTTHAPFGPVPPYQRQWPRILDPEPFDPAIAEQAMAVAPDLLNLRPSYVRAMSYEYASFAGYLREHPDDRLIMILIGDHQPPAAVTGPDASWSVPVHVITRNDAVADALLAHGFGPGLEPRRPSLGPMPALVPMLLDAFSHDGPAPAGY